MLEVMKVDNCITFSFSKCLTLHKLQSGMYMYFYLSDNFNLMCMDRKEILYVEKTIAENGKR